MLLLAVASPSTMASDAVNATLPMGARIRDRVMASLVGCQLVKILFFSKFRLPASASIVTLPCDEEALSMS